MKGGAPKWGDGRYFFRWKRLTVFLPRMALGVGLFEVGDGELGVGF